MAKLTDLVDRFRDAVTAHGTLRTFKFAYAYDINKDLRKEFPVLLLVPPDSEVSNYRSRWEESYSVVMWIFNQMALNDDQTLQEKWADIKDCAWDIIDTVTSRETLPTDYQLSSGVNVTLYPDEGNDRSVAVKFEFDMTVKDCRNE